MVTLTSFSTELSPAESDQERWLNKEPRGLAQLTELTGDAT
jgi:hypothetical protein